MWKPIRLSFYWPICVTCMDSIQGHKWGYFRSSHHKLSLLTHRTVYVFVYISDCVLNRISLSHLKAYKILHLMTYWPDLCWQHTRAPARSFQANTSLTAQRTSCPKRTKCVALKTNGWRESVRRLRVGDIIVRVLASSLNLIRFVHSLLFVYIISLPNSP